MRADRRARRLLAIALLGAALTSASGGCGGKDAIHPAHTAVAVQHPDRFTYARGLFRQMCGGCHTLADAGTHGKRLDLEESGVATIVHTRNAKVALARYAILVGEDNISRAGVAMPAWKGVLSRRQVDALSTYLGTVVGKGRRG
ncbi:MAG: cytochrome c [Bradyrhizobium sp.]